jgi:hypothetical protein
MKNSYDVKWSDKESVGSYVTEILKDRVEDLKDFHRDNYVNILWALLGRQDVYYDRFTRSIIDKKPPEWKVKIISNLLFPQVRRTIAKLAKQPVWDVMPATTEQADINISQLDKNILIHYWFYLRMPGKFIDFLTWLVCTGNGVFKVGWDAKSGETLKLTDEDKAVYKNATGKTKAPSQIWMGDPFIEVCSPFSVFWEKGQKLSESDWCIHVKLRTPDYVYKRYKVKVDPCNRKSDFYDFKLINLMNNGSTDSMSNKVAVVEYFDNDHYALLFNDNVHLIGANPYEEKPFVHVVEVPVPGAELGTSSVKQNRPNQAQYNGTRSRILQHSILMGNPKWAVARGAKIHQRSLDDRSGEVVEYNYPFKPDVIKPSALPAYIERILQTCRDDMRDIGSFHEVSQAQGEPGLRSGKAVLALQDADDLIQSVPLQLINEGLQEVGVKLLKVINKFVDEERLARITGDNKELQIFSFTGKSLQGQNAGRPGVNYFDVRISTYSAYPLTRIGMEERIRSLIEFQLLDPIQDRNKILSMLANSDLGAEMDEYAIDRTQATEENYAMLQGSQPQALPVENHQIHIDSHSKFIKSRKNSIDPEVLKLFFQHIDQHRMVEAQDMARQQQIVAMTLGPQNPMGQPGQ